MPGCIDIRVCAPGHVELLRCLGIRKLLNGGQFNVVEDGMQLGLLRADNVVDFERPVQMTAKNAPFQIANLSVAVMDVVASADITDECGDSSRTDQEPSARHIPLETKCFEDWLVWIAFKLRRTRQLHDADRQGCFFQDLPQLTGVK